MTKVSHRDRRSTSPRRAAARAIKPGRAGLAKTDRDKAGWFAMAGVAKESTEVLPIEEPATALLAEPTQARRFGKARTARTATLLEDYVELIADLIAAHGEARPVEIARRLGVSHVTVVKGIARLKREGLATARPYRGVFLTEAGQALAERVRDRHRLVVDVLLAVGVPKDAAEADAEGIEHHVSETTLAAFAQYLLRRAE